MTLTAAHLDLPAGSLVVDIVRIRLADGVPHLAGARQAARRSRSRPARAAARRVDLRPARAAVRRSRPRTWSSTWRWSRRARTRRRCSASPTRAPLLAITRTSTTADGVPFEFSNDLFRADRTCVTFRTKAERAEIVGREPGDPAT